MKNKLINLFWSILTGSVFIACGGGYLYGVTHIINTYLLHRDILFTFSVILIVSSAYITIWLKIMTVLVDLCDRYMKTYMDR